MDLNTIANIVMAGAAAITLIGGFILNNLRREHAAHAKRLDAMQSDLNAMHKREDANRETDRIDRDIANLRDDVSKGFDRLSQSNDRLYDRMAEDKREVLAAIAELKK